MVRLPRLRSALLPLSVVLAVVTCGGGDDITLPSEGLPTAIVALSGGGQSGVVGQPLTDTLVARVTDARDRPVQNQAVLFQVMAGGATADLIPDTAFTDADGRARSRWVLGTLAGPQRVEARVIATGAAGALKTTFNATGLADQADTILIVKGGVQSGTVGSLLSDSLGVLVTDRFGNPIAGRQVSWAIPAGQGSVSAAQTTTGPDGRTAVTRQLGPAAGAQTTTATSAGLKGSPVTFVHTATAGGAVALVKVSGDAQVAPAGFQLTDSLVVQARDANGNGVSGRTVIWVVATGNGAVSNQSSVTDAGGFAYTFWTLGTTAGSNSLTAATTGLPQVSFTATGTSAQPAKVQANSATSQNGTAGLAVATPPSVKVLDSNDNPVAGVTVTFAITQGGGTVSDGAASGPSVSIASNQQGVATLTNWTLGPTAGANALTATAAGTGLTGNPVTFSATGAAGSAARVLVTTEPSATAQSGVALTTQPVAQLVDAFGNVVAQGSVNVTASVIGSGVQLRGTAVRPTSAGGTATFTNLDLFGAVGSYSLQLSATGLTPDTTIAITLTAGPAAQLGMATQPSAAAASGVPFAQQPAVQVQDLAGNPVSASVAVTAVIASGGGSLGGTDVVQTGATGLATFTDLSITGSAGSRTLEFSAPGLASVTSTSVTIGAGNATQLALITQPSATAQSGSVLATQPVVQLRDASGNAVAQSGVPVTVTASGGATLGGNPTVNTDGQGQAVFSGLSLTGPSGSYTLSFAATGLAGVTSGTINLAAGSGTKLAITTQPPATAASGAVLAPPVVVQLLDQADNAVAQAGVPVVASIVTGAGGSLGGTDTVQTDAAGKATFSDLAITGPVGSYTLGFGSTGLTGATSTTIQLGTGAAARLLLLTPPPATAQSGVALNPQPVIQLEDGGGNAVAVAGIDIVASIASGGGTLGGVTTVQTNNLGQATFSGLTITGLAGSRTLAFNSAGLQGVTTGAISLTAGPAAILTLQAGNGQTAVAGSQLPVNPAVKVTDQSGNPVAGVSVNFEVTAGGGSVGNPVVLTDQQGVAQDGWTLGTTAGSNTLIAFATLAAGPDTVSFTATGTAGTAGKLAIVTQPPASSPSGAVLSPQPAIQLQDANGNPLTTSGIAIQASVSGATLTGITAFTTSGVATFSNLSITGLAGSYAITFSAPGQSITGVTSAPVTLTAGAAARLTMVAQPGGTIQSGIVIPQQPVLQVRDAAGNPVSASGLTVVAAINSGPGAVVDPVGRQVTTNGAGTASYSSLKLTGPVGTYSLIFSSGSLVSDTSVSFTLAAGNPASVAANSPTTQSAAAGSAVASPPSVLVRDGAGNPVPGVAVTFALTGGNGSLNGANQVTDAAGIATVTSWTLGPVAGANSLSATVSGSGITGNPVTFTATGTAGAAASIAVNAGNNQSAVVNSSVTTPPSVIVRDALNNPVSGVAVTFAVTSGGGQVTGANATTNASGVATVGSWTLGTAAGGNTLTATSGTLSGSPVTFTATGLAAPASILGKAAGDGQQATVGTAVAVPPQVLVTDQFGNPVGGVGITFAVASGGGSITGGNATTNSAGLASVGSWTLGATAGSNALTATAATGLTGSPATFTATGLAGAATKLAFTTAPSVAAQSGVALATQPVVQLRDANNNAVAQAGLTVTATITAGTAGTLTGASAVTNAAGAATFSGLTLSGTAGNFTLSFGSGSLTAVTAGVTLGAGPAATIVATSATTQSATVGTAVSAVPTVRVTDNGGNPVAGLTVTFTVTAGGGSSTGNTPQTDANGVASVGSWTVGVAPGANTLTATAATSVGGGAISGNPVTFTATGTVGPAVSIAVNAGDNQSAPAGSAVPTPPSVIVRDLLNNPVSGVAVTFAVVTGGGSLTGANATTNASGIATVGSWTLGSTAGSNTLTATSAGLLGSPVTFTATGTAGAATTLAKSAGDNQSATVNTAVTVPPQVLVTDQHGNPVSGVAVTFAVASGGGSITGGNATTNASGLASVGSWTLGTTPGSNTLTATSAGLTGSPATFTATATAGSASQLTITTQPSSTVQSGASFATQPVVQVRDALGNAVLQAGISVTASVASGGATLTGTATVQTNASGTATFTDLGLTGLVGTQTLGFASTGLTGVTSNSISLTAGPAAVISISAGNGQTGTVGTRLTTAPEVLVTDAAGNPVAGVATTWTPSGNGTINGQPTKSTDAAGHASAQWTLATTAGAQTLTVAATGLTGSPVTFTATATPDAAKTIALNAGDGQTAPVGTVVAVAPSVLVTDQYGNGVSGVAVTFQVTAGGGQVTGGAATSTASGIATVGSWTLGNTAGSNTLTASASGLTGSPVTFTATGTAGAPATVAISNGDGQSATVNTAVGTPPSVVVRDQFNNVVSGASVTFAVASGGGSVTGGNATTNASGIATVGSWTLGTTAGSNTLTATVGGLTPVTFTATGTADAAAKLQFLVQPVTTPVNQTMAAVQVRLLDAFDNPVATDGVDIALALGNNPVGGTPLTVTSPVATVNGIATFSDIIFTVQGNSYDLVATSSGLTSATSSAFDIN